MEACDIVLILTLLFSIKGQTVQNSTVIPHTLCSHFTPVSFYTVITMLLHSVYIKVIDTGVASSTPPCITILFSWCFFLWSSNYTFASVLFFHQPANQKAASGAGRLSGEGGDPDVSAGCQCEFVYFKRRCLNSRLICMITCCQRAFMESVAYRSSGRNINLWDTH